MARPTKVTPAAWKAFLTAIQAGNTRTASSGYAGFSRDALRRALARNAQFRADLEKAEADAEVGHVANIAKEAKAGNWTASAWWLERRRHQDWGRIDRVEITLRDQAERLAQQLGVPAASVLAEAERLLREAGADG